jgi:hypothetical protein
VCLWRLGRSRFAAMTSATYETLTRLHVLPGLVPKRLDKLTLRDVRSWLDKLRGHLATAISCHVGR